MVVYAFTPSTPKAGAGGPLLVQGQLSLFKWVAAETGLCRDPACEDIEFLPY